MHGNFIKCYANEDNKIDIKGKENITNGFGTHYLKDVCIRRLCKEKCVVNSTIKPISYKRNVF